MEDRDRGTCDEFPVRSIDVVNPHSWPVLAKNAKISLGEWEPTQTDTMAGGREPTQAWTQSWRTIESEASRTDEVDAFFIGRS